MDDYEKRALVLQQRYKPSEIVVTYNTEMQDTIMAVCPTVDIARDIPSPMLGVLSKAYPEIEFVDNDGVKHTIEDTAITVMQSHVLQAQMFIGIKEKLDEWHIKALCRQILSEYPMVTVAEFILFCARLRSGVYETFYGVIDASLIIKSFRTFMIERRKDHNRRMNNEEKEEVRRAHGMSVRFQELQFFDSKEV